MIAISRERLEEIVAELAACMVLLYEDGQPLTENQAEAVRRVRAVRLEFLRTSDI